jgi:hypothetical protein
MQHGRFFDIGLITHNQFEISILSPGIEDRNMEYWGKLVIAARWKIAADSFKGCGIKITSLDLTVMEKTDGSPPDIDIGSPIEQSVTNTFYARDVFRRKNSIKAFYLRNFNDGKHLGSRTSANFGFAKVPYSDPNNQIMLLKRESIYAPMLQKNSTVDERKFVMELHELYHALADEDDDTAHVPSDPSIPRNPLKTRLTQTSGSFTAGPGGQCEKMIEKGRQLGLLRCE